MKAKRNGMELFALCTGALVFATSASALARTLPTPPPSEYVDAESSNCVLLDPSQGPLMRLWLAADFSPTNAVIVDIGTDANNDGNLSPGEVVLRLGVDCGVPFARSESKSEVEVEQWNLSTCASGLEKEGNILRDLYRRVTPADKDDSVVKCWLIALVYPSKFLVEIWAESGLDFRRVKMIP